MVEERRNATLPETEADKHRSAFGRFVSAAPVLIRRRWKTAVVAAILVVGSSWVLGSAINKPTARASSPQENSVVTPKVGTGQAHQTTVTTTTVAAPVVTTTSTSATVTSPVITARAPTPPATVSAPAPVVVAAAAPAAAPSTAPSVAALVSQVEASGIDPGSNWSWSMGDTATHCGGLVGDGTGCTYGSGGLEYSVFAGTPTLALVAHELANAETQNDAVPSLLSQVAAVAGGSTWSPTDGVASCLVAHFMGFQDSAAGSWQCPAALAATVAANIHNSI
jgi:hypothetical protein